MPSFVQAGSDLDIFYSDFKIQKMDERHAKIELNRQICQDENLQF